MIPSSMRRIATGTPQASSALISSIAPISARASPAVAFAYNHRCQQRRRYSSSKPSSPNDSPKNVPDGQVAATPSTTKRGGRRKAKDSLLAAQQANLPSVPSTHHVPHEALALSTFFSLHRPMSVTHSFPKTITEDAFAQIFATRSKTDYNEVVSTLSRTVDDLQQPMESMTVSGQQETDGMVDNSGDGMHKIDIRNPDGSESSVYVQLNTMSGQYLPFRPPPLPQPRSESAGEVATEAAAVSSQVTEETPDHRVYKAVFTLEETREHNGEIKIVAHSPQILEDAAPRTFLERMALRQVRRQLARDESSTMHAISVKRQRKLKMKKMKYKRLMKKTRNLRRKLDRV